MTLSEVAQFLGEEEIPQSKPNIQSEVLFDHLPYPTFESKEIFEDVIKETARAKADDAIPAEKIWLGIYFDREIRHGLHPPVSIRFIDAEIGYGVFAEKRIPSCGFAGEYTGIVKERNPKLLKGEVYSVRYPLWNEEKKRYTGAVYVLDAKERGNFTRFLNHSDRPNLSLQSVYWRGIPRMIFIALREIKEGEQLTFDYGPLFWKEFATTPKSL